MEDSKDVQLDKIKDEYVALPYANIIKNVYKEFKQPIDDSLTVTIDSSYNLNILETYLESKLSSVAGIMEIRDYVLWRMLHELVYYMPSYLRDIRGKHMINVNDGGVDKKVKETFGMTAENFCMKLTNIQFKSSLAWIYAKDYFSDKTSKDVRNMIEKIKLAYGETVKSSSWIKGSLRKNLLAKLNRLDSIIGLPDAYKNVSSTDEYYKKLSINENSSHLENVIKLMAFNQLSYFTNTNSDEEYYVKSMEPLECGAYYYNFANVLTISMGEMNNPFYNSKLPKSMNYGALGSILAHELGHLIISDKDEDISPRIKRFKNFQLFQQCLAKDYSSYNIKGLKIHQFDPMNLMLEIIPDHLGLIQAYKAAVNMSSSVKQKQIIRNLHPKLNNVTDQMLYFINYAQKLCSHHSEIFVVDALQNGFVPNIMRVNVPLRNSPEFSKAFQCSKSSFMNPINKCQFWN